MGKIIEPHHDLETIRKLAIDHLHRGVSRKNHPFRSFVFATSEPNARMVILRKVITDPLTVLVYTDARSDKMKELRSNSKAALLFWHPSSRFQLKLRTRVSIHVRNEMANQHWKQIGQKGKESYNTAAPPGTTLEKSGKVEFKEPFDGEDFTVLVCTVEEMEILQLRREGHIRAKFVFNGERSEANFLVP